MIDEMKTVLSTLTDLPPMPPVAARVMALMGDRSSSAKDLAAAISIDPAVTAQILKIANSAYYSLPRRVKTLDHAVVVLGEKTLRSLVMAACLRGFNKKFGPVEKMLWEDAVGCATAARLLAGRLQTADPEEAFLGGLFRNLGKLVMNYQDSLKYRQLVDEAGCGEQSFEELEQKYFPFSHPLIGAAVLAKWKFPEPLTYVVRYYRSRVRAGDEAAEVEGLLGTVNIADGFCRRQGLGRAAAETELRWQSLPGTALLAVDDRTLDRLFAEFATVFEQNRTAILT